MKLPSLNRLFENASVSFRRFPLALLSAITAALLGLYMVEEKIKFETSHTQFVMTCLLGIPLFFSIALFSTRAQLNLTYKILLNSAGLILLSLYFFFLPEKFSIRMGIQFWLFNIGLHLLVSFAPFIRRGTTNGFWQFNKSLFLRFLTGGFYSGVLFAGISIAIVAVDQLFKADIKEIRFFQLWIVIAGIFNTWFFLSGIPGNLGELDDEEDYPKGLKIFTQFVLLPLVSLYLLILYAYETKIAMTWELPVGWVSYLVIGFSTLGVLSLLLIFPVQDKDENRWIKIFSRWFFLALFPLVGMLFVAIGRRVMDYGITENRYFILVLALWLAGIATLYSVRKFRHIRIIPVSLCIIIFLTSFGPWGAFSVSQKSQQRRFEKLLEKNNMLLNGVGVKANAKISFQDEKQISSIVTYLVEMHGPGSLQKYFTIGLDSLFKADSADRSYSHPQKIVSLLGLKYLNRWDSDEETGVASFVYRTSGNAVTDVSGFDYLLDYSGNNYKNDSDSVSLSHNNAWFAFPPDSVRVKVLPGGKIILTVNESPGMEFNVDALAGTLRDSAISEMDEVTPAMMLLENENDLYKTRIVFNRISGNQTGEKISVKNFEAKVLVKRKKPEQNTMSY